MKNGWRDFFKNYPDYRNIFTCVTVQNDVVVWLVIPPALINHLTAQAYGRPNCMVNASPNGESIGWTKGKNQMQASKKKMAIESTRIIRKTMEMCMRACILRNWESAKDKIALGITS